MFSLESRSYSITQHSSHVDGGGIAKNCESFVTFPLKRRRRRRMRAEKFQKQFSWILWLCSFLFFLLERVDLVLVRVVSWITSREQQSLAEDTKVEDEEDVWSWRKEVFMLLSARSFQALELRKVSGFTHSNVVLPTMSAEKLFPPTSHMGGGSCEQTVELRIRQRRKLSSWRECNVKIF